MRKAGSASVQLLAGAAMLFFLAAALSRFLSAQALPLDDKARYERSLEEKAEEVILKLLGPNQAKVVVQAGMDFTRIEKMDIVTGEVGGADASGEGGSGKDKAFKWQTASADGQPMNEYLLPGFPSMGELGKAPAQQNQTYQKQLIFPVSFIKKLTVSVILNKDITAMEEQDVRRVVSEILGLDLKRGDELTIVKTTFAPIWKTIWYSPDAINLLFKYGIFTLMGIISMIVVAVGFLKLAAAMNTIAKAQQSHQITMDLGKGAAGIEGLGGGGGPLGGKIELITMEKKEGQAGEQSEEQSVVFNIKPEQVDFLVTLMGGEDPANIALIVGRLESGVRTEFLRKLPPDVSSEVISSMASVRFVESEVIMTIKEELEKRLAGAYGGVSTVLESLDKVNLKTKKEMLERLAQRHPDVARDVRSKIFMAEDLLKFSERELSLLASAVKLDDWAGALWALPAEFKEKLHKQLAEKTWQILEQTMKYGSPTAEKSEQAVETIVNAALALIKEGKVANPLETPVEPAGAAGSPPGVKAGEA